MGLTYDDSPFSPLSPPHDYGRDAIVQEGRAQQRQGQQRHEH